MTTTTAEPTTTTTTRAAKHALLKQLRTGVYCRLAPSKVHGVGVVAVRDIPANTRPFLSPYRRPYPIVELSRRDVDSLLPAVGTLVRDFFLPEAGGEQFAAVDPNLLDVSFYLNHASNPDDVNVRAAPCVDGCGYDDVVTTRAIRAGEELLLDYHESVPH